MQPSGKLTVVEACPTRGNDGDPARRQTLVDAARAIAEHLLQLGIERPDGGLDWMGLSGYATRQDPLRDGPVDFNLYNGTPGIAIFLAAVWRTTGDERYREACLRALVAARTRLAGYLAAPGATLSRSAPIGALIGLGSWIYGFLRAGLLADEPALVDEAHRATALLTPERIAADERVWVQIGSAGTILALLALHEERAEANRRGSTPLDLASLCGRRVLASQVSWDGWPPAWPLCPGKPPLLGFSYGAAGVSYALQRLHRVTGDADLLAAAQTGLEFTRSLYSPEHGAWRDMQALFMSCFKGPVHGEWKDWWKATDPSRAAPLAPLPEKEPWAPPPPSAQMMSMWCHGAPGLLLARLAVRERDDDPAAAQDIAASLNLTRALSQPEPFAAELRDDLCCGHAGRIEALSQAAHRLDDGELLEEAWSLAERLVARAASSGYQFSCARGTTAFAPSLFQGAAGIGYTLLRLARPQALPCILLIE